MLVLCFDSEDRFTYAVAAVMMANVNYLYYLYVQDDRRGSRGSIFGSLGINESHPPTQRRASFQALGESVVGINLIVSSNLMERKCASSTCNLRLRITIVY